MSPELAELMRTTTKAVDRWLRARWLPPPIRLGPKGRWVRWRRKTIEEFLNNLEEKQHEQ